MKTGVEGQRALLVEVCVENQDGVRIARDAGADRVELCRDLSTGGLTPSDATFLASLDDAPPEGIRVLVRENPDSFELTGAQVAQQAHSIRHLVSLIPPDAPPVGFVVGGLSGGRIDRDAALQWREAAGERYLVFHRAFDQIEDQDQALLELIDLGYDGVLTTGDNSKEGNAKVANPKGLARLRELAAGRITVIGSGGVRYHNAAQVVSEGNLTDLHFQVPDPDAEDGGLASVKEVVRALR